MEHIVLGLLMLKSMTIYELNQTFRHGLSLIYSASYGNLQYAVNKLITNDMINFKELVDNGRNKKIYRINRKGIAEFYNWMNAECDTKQIETQMLSKVFFMGLVQDKEDKINIINSLLKAAGQYKDELIVIKKETDNMDLPDEYMEIAKYQFKTLSYGADSLELAENWLHEILDEIK